MICLKILLSIASCLAVALPSIAGAIIVAPSGATYSSIQTGLNAANPGDTVYVAAGTYTEAVSFGKSGSSGSPIVLRAAASAVTKPVINATGHDIAVNINSQSNVQIIGFEIENASGGDPSAGIYNEGSGSNILIKKCYVHDITCDESSKGSNGGNAHGIAFYGRGAITHITIDSNEVTACKLGQSETVVLNGNVDTFTISNNAIHDNDNIGIDIIGFEKTASSGIDQARNGTVVGNHVYNISSKNNGTYSDLSADGIYVDGGENVIIERNTVDSCDVGIELESEQGGLASNVTVRDNFISRSYQDNIAIGGYESGIGGASNIVAVNNTTYHAGAGSSGEIDVRYNCTTVSIKNNICIAKSGNIYIANGSNNTGITVDNNLYYGSSSSSAGDFSDAHAKYADPKLVSTYLDMHISAGSPAINAGSDLGTISGTKDIDGEARVYGSSIDIGADEYGSAVSIGKKQTAQTNLSSAGIRFEHSASVWSFDFCLSQSALVSYEVMDLRGKTLLNSPAKNWSVGNHSITIGAEMFSKQIYLLKAKIGSDTKTFRIVNQ